MDYDNLMTASKVETTRASMAFANEDKSVAFDKAGQYYIYTFSKASSAEITKDDLTLKELDIATKEIINNLPQNVIEETTTEVEAETTTEKPVETTTEAPVVETTTEKPAETTTKAEVETTTEAVVEDETTTEAVAEETTTEQYIKANYCGESLTWDFDSSTGTLTIDGTGDMYNYNYSYYRTYDYNYGYYRYSYHTTAPWSEYYNIIKKVVIKENVAYIGSYAFYGCNNIYYLEIPNSTNFYYDSFYDCNNIRNIKITNGSNEALDYRNNHYYSPWYRNQSASISFDSSVEAIGNYMFYCCNYSNINLPSKLKYIGECAFAHCDNLQNITIPNYVENIGDRAFIYCTNLQNVNLGNGKNLTLSYDVFNNCPSIDNFCIGSANKNYCTDENGVLYNKDMTGLIKYPSGCPLTSYTVDSNIAYINEYAFENSSNLEEVILPENMMSIGSYAFKDCTSLTQANIPDGLYTLCYAAFDGCTSIEKVVLPESLKTFGGHSFRNCVNLKEVIFNCKNCQGITNGYSPFEGAGSESGGFTLTFTDNVVSIPDNLFYNYQIYYYDGLLKYEHHYYVTEITIGKAVTGNNWDRFTYLEDLTTVNFNATKCNYLSFNECPNLSSVIIGENVTKIPDSFLYGCSAVTEINIPESVIEIGEEAFYETGIYNEKSNWNNNTLFIGNNLIKVDERTTGEFVIPNDTRVVANGAFKNSRITEITIPESIVSLGRNSFYQCESLTDVNFNATDCKYAEDCFYNASVNNFNIGNNVKTLPAYLLAGCEKLNEVRIPQSVEYIGQNVFGYGTLSKIYFENTERFTIENSLFYRDFNCKTVIYCRQNSFIHSFAEMNILPICLYTDSGDYFNIKNGVLESYTGSSKEIFVNCASKIGYGAFENNDNIEYIELSSEVTAIFNAAFKNCANLQNIIISQNVSSIGSNAFDGCDNLVIWCYAGSYAEYYAKNKNIEICYITLELSKQEIKLQESETCMLTASFSTVVTDDTAIFWRSDNPSVATVTSDGKITAVGVGKATITATTSTGLYATCLVNVTRAEPEVQPRVKSVKIDDASVNYKGEMTVDTAINVDNGVSYYVIYKSSDPKVATVDENGKVVANKVGKTTITCIVVDEYGNRVKDTATVRVKYSTAQWIINILLFGFLWYR